MHPHIAQWVRLTCQTKSGLELPAPPGGTHGSPLYIRFFPLAYVIGFAMMTFTLLVASWWPSRRAARLNPVEALAHV